MMYWLAYGPAAESLAVDAQRPLWHRKRTSTARESTGGYC